MPSELFATLPPLRGKLREEAELAPTNWFRVGGPAELLFRPEDREDLQLFLGALPAQVAVTPLGVGSNLIIRDGGIAGAVVRLGKGFTGWQARGEVLELGAGLLCAQAAELAAAHRLGGLEFLCGIPGALGGALAMNAGAYGQEMKDVLVEAEFVTRSGEVARVTPAQLQYRYRHAEIPPGAVFTRAWLTGIPESDEATLRARMAEITAAREATQPVRARTGGSTFKNPEGDKAWRLIDEAGCRGLTRGAAQVSELHCNFLLNLGEAKAADLEDLGEEVRARVTDKTGVTLEWEIKRIGKRAEPVA